MGTQDNRGGYGPERREQGQFSKLADSATLKLVTAFVTLFMVPLVWRIADTLTDMRTNATLMELRVHQLEILVPTRTDQIKVLNDSVLGLTYRVGDLERTCKRIAVP